jgi:hypothetical protein
MIIIIIIIVIVIIIIHHDRRCPLSLLPDMFHPISVCPAMPSTPARAANAACKVQYEPSTKFSMSRQPGSV